MDGNSNRKKNKKVKNKKSVNWDEEFDSDENFAFIAGFTSGGAPFGITHEEWEEIENTISESKDAEWEEIENSNPTTNDEDLPF